MTDKNFIFIGGLHRSGTSFLSHLLANSEAVSAFPETGFPENEGQYLQSLLLREEDTLGVGAFGYHPGTHMDESHFLATEETARALYASWEPYWDTEKTFLLEKTPKNLLRTRFLQKLFPNSAFVVMMRHPLAVFLATMKWDYSSAFSQVSHWLHCYERFLADSSYLNSVYLLRYEDLMEKTNDLLADLLHYIGLPEIAYEDCFFPLLSELKPLCRKDTTRKTDSITGRTLAWQSGGKPERSGIKEVVKTQDEDGNFVFDLLLENSDHARIILKKEGRKLMRVSVNGRVLPGITHQNSQTTLRIAAPEPMNLNSIYFRNMDTLLAEKPRYRWDQELFKEQRLNLERRVNAFGYSLYRPEAITQPKWLLNRHGGLLQPQKRRAVFTQ